MKSIPKGWRIERLDVVAKRGTGHTPSKSKPTYWGGSIRWISLGDTTRLDRVWIDDAAACITKEGLDNSSTVLHPSGTVILLRGSSVGKSAIMRREMAISQDYVTWACGPDLNNVYLYYWLQHMKPVFQRISNGSTVKTIGMPFFEKLEVKFPERPQQTTIADILLFWDVAIFKLESLVAAKVERKRGLMQQLLTGQRRFKEFNGEKWKKLPAGKMFQNRSQRNDCGAPVLSVTQDQGIVLRASLDRRISADEDNHPTYKLVQPGDFVISLRSFQGGLEYSSLKGAVSPAYHVITPKIEVCADFYRHYFKSYEFIARLAVTVIGIRDGKQVSFGDFEFLKLPYPPIGEQKRIADALDTCDREIEMLQKQLEALKEQKRGLMQKLLTGEVRVKI